MVPRQRGKSDILLSLRYYSEKDNASPTFIIPDHFIKCLFLNFWVMFISEFLSQALKVYGLKPCINAVSSVNTTSQKNEKLILVAQAKTAHPSARI